MFHELKHSGAVTGDIPYAPISQRELADRRCANERDAYEEILIERTVDGAKAEQEVLNRSAMIRGLLIGAALGFVLAWAFSAIQWWLGAI